MWRRMRGETIRSSGTTEKDGATKWRSNEVKKEREKSEEKRKERKDNAQAQRAPRFAKSKARRLGCAIIEWVRYNGGVGLKESRDGHV